jgi:hypothetical protein
MNERSLFSADDNHERLIDEASHELLGELSRNKQLDEWGVKMGDPNPWLADFRPIKKSRSEKKEEEEQRLTLENNKKNRRQVLGEIAAFYRAWKMEKRVEDEMALKIWENMTNNLQHRGWPGMRDAVLEALYNPEEGEQAA